jgi:hypothetical protein
MTNSSVFETSTRRRRLLAIVRRHPLSVWALWGVGLLVLLATMRYAAVDPAFIALFIDPELAAALVLVAIALLRADVARYFSLSVYRIATVRERLRR